jgi:hypothetical protein
MLSTVRTRVSWRPLRQRNPSTDGKTRQRKAEERNCCQVMVSAEVVAGVEPTETGQNAETDSDRREATGEGQRGPDMESVLCDFSCSRPGEEYAGCYRGRGCRFVGGHQLDLRRDSENCGDTVSRKVVSTDGSLTARSARGLFAI